MSSIIAYPKAPPPGGYRGWRKVRLSDAEGIQGTVLVCGTEYCHPNLIEWIDKEVFVEREDDHRVSVWADDPRGSDDPYYIAIAVSELAGFFARTWFGEANQADYHGMAEIIDHILIEPAGAGRIEVTVDHYTARYGNNPGWDVDQWDAEKYIRLVSGGHTAKERFRAAYSLARAELRHPNVRFLGRRG
jgi:hypothetical protein